MGGAKGLAQCPTAPEWGGEEVERGLVRVGWSGIEFKGFGVLGVFGLGLGGWGCGEISFP